MDGFNKMIYVGIIQGKGMDLRGQIDTDIFGYDTLDEINSKIETYASRLNIKVKFFQTNVESELLTILKGLESSRLTALIFNPGGFTTSLGNIGFGLQELTIPVFEVHTTNPASRGIISQVQGSCSGSVYGFGISSYLVALTGLTQILYRERK